MPSSNLIRVFGGVLSACALIFALVLPVSRAVAQVTTGIISGTLRDSTGSVIPGGNIKVSHLETGSNRTAVTDATGHFLFSQLPVGEYEVQAESAGFRTQVRKGIVLTVGKEAAVNITLEVGEITEKVEVSGEAPLVETASSSLAGLVDEKQVRDLPLNGRSFDQLITLTPGTVQFGNKRRNVALGLTSGFSAGGARWEASKFTWDGVEIVGSNSVSTTPNSASGKLLGVEAIQEFAVVTNNGDATYGKKFGGQINVVTRAGSNSFHGNVYWFLRNNHLDARNFFDPGNVPQFKQNNFGVAVGGPFRRDKSWFFANYEGYRQRLGLSNVAIVPDADARRGILPLPDPANPSRLTSTNVGVAPGEVPALPLYPEPNGPNLGGGKALAFSSPSETTNEDFLVLRVDHSVSADNNLYARYFYDNSTLSSPRENPHFAQFIPTRAQQAVLGLKTVFSPTVVNNFVAGFTRAAGINNVVSDVPIPPSLIFEEGAKGTGNIVVQGLNDLGGYNLSALLAGRFHNRNVFTYADQVNLIRGRHFLQAGTQIERIQANENQGTSRRGLWRFDGLLEFLQGTATSFQAPVAGSNGEKGWRQTYVSFFFQDNFRILSNFSLNLGLRYEFMTNISEVNGRIANYELVGRQLTNPLRTESIVSKNLWTENNSLRNLAPRIGFAWDVFGQGKTAVRGGFGVFYNQIEDDHRRGLGANTPFFTVLQAANVRFPTTAAALAGVAGLPRPTGVARYADTPTMLQYNLRVEQSLGAQTRVAAAYVGSHAFHLARMTDPQVAAPTILSDGRLFYPLGTVRKNPQLAVVGELIVYDANSFYNSLQLEVERRIKSGLRFKAAYTWSKSIDDSSGTLAVTNAATTDLFPTNHKGDRGLSGFDLTHSFALNWSYDLPFASLFKTSGRLVEGWQLTGILNLLSGQPFTTEVGFSRARNGTSNTFDRPDLAPGKSNNPILGSPSESPRYFDPNAFLLQPEGFVGNLARNTLRAPGIATADLGLQKNIPFTEALGLQFRWEVFNLLNRANFKFPTVRQIFTRQGTIIGSSGVLTETSTSSRQMQVSLKLTF